jgi:hypothetical protein
MIPRLLLILCLIQAACATTWDEPWMEDVIRDADAFVKADVVSSGERRFSARRLKQLAGVDIPEKFEVVGFSMLEIKSTSGESGETALRFNPELDYYLFLKRADKPGEFHIATPTSGWAKILSDGNVNTTYRHSYHQALVPSDIYEPTMTAIFKTLHHQTADTNFVGRYIRDRLSRKPALISKSDGKDDTANEFFAQHVALECFRYFGTETELPKLSPFLTASDGHVQISAVCAVAGVNSPKVPAILMDFVEGDHDGFAKVVALDGLAAHDARSFLPRVKKFIQDGKDEETGWGGNIMDPRVGSYFPESVKAAARNLESAWERGQRVTPHFGSAPQRN